MNINSLALCVTVLLSFVSTGVTQTTAPKDTQSKTELNKNLKCFAPFMGTWIINSEWSSGNKLWAKNKYEIGLGGNFVVARTWAKDGDGEPYERYLTIFAWDKTQNKIVAHGFTNDGSVRRVEMDVESADGKEVLRSQWQPDPNSATIIKQEVSVMDADQYSWKVWSGSSETAELQPLMDGVWKRQPNE